MENSTGNSCICTAEVRAMSLPVHLRTKHKCAVSPLVPWLFCASKAGHASQRLGAAGSPKLWMLRKQVLQTPALKLRYRLDCKNIFVFGLDRSHLDQVKQKRTVSWLTVWEMSGDRKGQLSMFHTFNDMCKHILLQLSAAALVQSRAVLRLFQFDLKSEYFFPLFYKCWQI